ncbi:hypothetical protein BXO8_16915 [Xanthomonas oryzae pv. oryzae]|nr:hypothetical protein BXO8_16915 [Xanthomonas oryzae pv. oryzae]
MNKIVNRLLGNATLGSLHALSFSSTASEARRSVNALVTAATSSATSIGSFHQGVIGWCATPGEVQLHPVFIYPPIHDPAGKLTPVVHLDSS